jgi:hypothetical protein
MDVLVKTVVTDAEGKTKRERAFERAIRILWYNAGRDGAVLVPVNGRFHDPKKSPTTISPGTSLRSTRPTLDAGRLESDRNDNRTRRIGRFLHGPRQGCRGLARFQYFEKVLVRRAILRFA